MTEVCEIDEEITDEVITPKLIEESEGIIESSLNISQSGILPLEAH